MPHVTAPARDALMKARNQPCDYLTAAGNSWNLAQARRLMDLATEYKPRTK